MVILRYVKKGCVIVNKWQVDWEGMIMAIYDIQIKSADVSEQVINLSWNNNVYIRYKKVRVLVKKW